MLKVFQIYATLKIFLNTIQEIKRIKLSIKTLKTKKLKYKFQQCNHKHNS